MKIRTDFVTNSSSSCFYFQITINLKDGKKLSFNARGSGSNMDSEYFCGTAYITVSPKELGLSKDIEELIDALTKGVYDEYGWNGDIRRQIFSKDCPSECYGQKYKDASEFIDNIRGAVGSMDDIKTIVIEADTHFGHGNEIFHTRQYTYDLETKKYTGHRYDDDVENCEGDDGYLQVDTSDCEITQDDNPYSTIHIPFPEGPCVT